MLRKTIGRIALGSLVLAATSILLPLTATAQDDGPTFNAVRTIHVKPSMTSEFIEGQRQLNEALHAAGRPARNVYQEIRGELGTFYVVQRIESFSQYDGEFTPPMSDEDWAAWVEAYGDSVESSARTISRTHPEFSIPLEEGATPELLIIRRTNIAPGQGGAFHSWVEEKLVPALKEQGVTGMYFSHIAFGGDTNRWIFASFIDNWAQLDEPSPVGRMSAEEREALFEGWGEMVWGSDVRILRYREDLSHSGPE